MKGIDWNLSLPFKIILCDHIKSFTFQKLELNLHREGDVLVITIHNLQKTKVKFVIIIEYSNLSVVPPNVIFRLKGSSCFMRPQSLFFCTEQFLVNVLGASHAIRICACSICLHKEASENIQVKSEVTEGCHLISLHGRCSLVMCHVLVTSGWVKTSLHHITCWLLQLLTFASHELHYCTCVCLEACWQSVVFLQYCTNKNIPKGKYSYMP